MFPGCVFKPLKYVQWSNQATPIPRTPGKPTACVIHDFLTWLTTQPSIYIKYTWSIYLYHIHVYTYYVYIYNIYIYSEKNTRRNTVSIDFAHLKKTHTTFDPFSMLLKHVGKKACHVNQKCRGFLQLSCEKQPFRSANFIRIDHLDLAGKFNRSLTWQSLRGEQANKSDTVFILGEPMILHQASIFPEIVLT